MLYRPHTHSLSPLHSTSSLHFCILSLSIILFSFDFVRVSNPFSSVPHIPLTLTGTITARCDTLPFVYLFVGGWSNSLSFPRENFER